MFFKNASGILGMNARNFSYISKYNSAADKKFADNKIFTKHFLGSRGIGVAKLFHTVKNHTQLSHEFFESLPASFVIKPNKGYAGGGILVIREKKNNLWVTVSGKKLDEEFLYRHCIDILEGKYSISGVYDQVIFEEKLEPHPDFRNLSDVGLPDIRVVVFNSVPVLAMLRVPTHESDGKANMELGAIGLGVDIGTGVTTGGAYYSKFVKKMPNGQSTVGFQVPFWDEILLTVCKIQNFSKIGFLGVDLVVTKSDVKVLELNARTGLKIQIANRIPMRARLEKVADLKVASPEDGFRIAKTLFSRKSSSRTEEKMDKKPVIGIFEPVILYGDKPQTLTAKVDLLAKENFIIPKYYDGSIMDLSIEGKRLKLPVEKKSVSGADLILSGKFLKDFYVDPNKKLDLNPTLLTANLDEKIIKNIDEKVCELDGKIKLLSCLNPQNLAEQKALFLSQPNFSPRFLYREPSFEFEYLRNELRKIPREADHFLLPLYIQKIDVIEAKLNLLEHMGSIEFGDFSKKVFGGVSQSLYRSALTFLKENSDDSVPDKSPELDLKKAMEVLNEFLVLKKLSHWKIKVLDDSVSDIQVSKKNFILLRKGATFRLNRLKALLAHEIGTHVFRYENGKLQPFRIFERGTANYLRTEEGLAIWNQNELNLDLGDKFLTPALLVVAIYMAERMSFQDLFHFLKTTHNIDDNLAWKLCVKSKRGLKDTKIHTAFTKDSLYFVGSRMVKKFLKKGGKIEDLYVGKVDIEDLPLVQQIEGLKPAKFLL